MTRREEGEEEEEERKDVRGKGKTRRILTELSCGVASPAEGTGFVRMCRIVPFPLFGLTSYVCAHLRQSPVCTDRVLQCSAVLGHHVDTALTPPTAYSLQHPPTGTSSELELPPVCRDPSLPKNIKY
jgi:hypothetical protein